MQHTTTKLTVGQSMGIQQEMPICPLMGPIWCTPSLIQPSNTIPLYARPSYSLCVSCVGLNDRTWAKVELKGLEAMPTGYAFCYTQDQNRWHDVICACSQAVSVLGIPHLQVISVICPLKTRLWQSPPAVVATAAKFHFKKKNTPFCSRSWKTIRFLSLPFQHAVVSKDP